MFDFSNEQKQREMGVAIPGGSIVAVKIKVDDRANEKGLKRNADNNKNIFSVSLEVISDPFKGAIIFDNQTVGVDDVKAKGAKQNLDMGRAAVRGLIDSIAGLSEDDDSPAAMKKRRVPHLRVLDGRTAVVKTKLEPSQDGTKEYARVAKYVTAGEQHYNEAAGGTSFVGDIEPKQVSGGGKKPGGGDDWGGVDPIPGSSQDTSDDWASGVDAPGDAPGDAGGESAVPDWA